MQVMRGHAGHFGQLYSYIMPTLEKGYIGGMSQFRKEWLRAKKTGKMRGQSEAAFRECFFQ